MIPPRYTSVTKPNLKEERRSRIMMESRDRKAETGKPKVKKAEIAGRHREHYQDLQHVGIPASDHLHGCNKRLSEDRRNVTLDTPILVPHLLYWGGYRNQWLAAPHVDS